MSAKWPEAGRLLQSEGLNYRRFVVSRSKLVQSRGKTKKQGSPFISVIPAIGASINSQPAALLLEETLSETRPLLSSLSPLPCLFSFAASLSKS